MTDDSTREPRRETVVRGLTYTPTNRQIDSGFRVSFVTPPVSDPNDIGRPDQPSRSRLGTWVSREELGLRLLEGRW